jgi:hypothetical protein
MFHVCASLYLKRGGEMRTFIELEGTETEGDIVWAHVSSCMCLSVFKKGLER